MSDLRRIIEQTIDVEAGARVVLETGATVFQSASTQNLWRGTQLIYRTTLLMSDTTTPFSAPAVDDATWLFGIDNVFTADHADLAVTLNADFNKAEDWDEVDPTVGKVCWRVDLTGAALKAAMGTTPSSTMYACLWMTPTGESPVLILQWPITMNNVAVDPTTAIEVPGVVHVTSDALDAILNDLKNPTGGTFKIANGNIYWWNAIQSKWQTMLPTGVAGSETVDISQGID